jgi:hypothetical protein
MLSEDYLRNVRERRDGEDKGGVYQASMPVHTKQEHGGHHIQWEGGRGNSVR